MLSLPTNHSKVCTGHLKCCADMILAYKDIHHWKIILVLGSGLKLMKILLLKSSHFSVHENHLTHLTFPMAIAQMSHERFHKSDQCLLNHANFFGYTAAFSRFQHVNSGAIVTLSITSGVSHCNVALTIVQMLFLRVRSRGSFWVLTPLQNHMDPHFIWPWVQWTHCIDLIQTVVSCSLSLGT